MGTAYPEDLLTGTTASFCKLDAFDLYTAQRSGICQFGEWSVVCALEHDSTRAFFSFFFLIITTSIHL